MKKPIVFLCGARDYHAMDWYRSALQLLPDGDICIITDLIGGEGFKVLINKNDKIFKLLILDNVLFKNQSRIGNIWRNFIKLLVFPIQVILLKRFSKTHINAIFHAHSMYYLFLGWAAGINYIGTPQGSDILVRPFRSRLFKYFSIKSLKAAKAITVDSANMRDKILELANVDSLIIQNGIDIESISKFVKRSDINYGNRTEWISIRGITPLYRIKEIINGRNLAAIYKDHTLTFIYPFIDNEYKNEISKQLNTRDIDLGRITREEMYLLFFKSEIVFSFPISDSSPRSVYEAIFCGCPVAITYNQYYESLPNCMKSRIIIVDLEDKNWFSKCVIQARQIMKTKFYPSNKALELFDQKKSFKKLADLFYN